MDYLLQLSVSKIKLSVLFFHFFPFPAYNVVYFFQLAITPFHIGFEIAAFHSLKTPHQILKAEYGKNRFVIDFKIIGLTKIFSIAWFSLAVSRS